MARSSKKEGRNGQNEEKATPLERKKEKAGTKARKRNKSDNSAYNRFMRVYKGLEDWHIPIFKSAKAISSATRCLYPGCDKHITASLVFSDVTYVDFNEKVSPTYTDKRTLEWVHENKTYKEENQIVFFKKDFENEIAFELESFDLLISASAGIVSTYCEKYLKKGGYFLAGDAHYDARKTFLNPNFLLVGVYDWDKQSFETSDNALKGHFMTVENKRPITEAEVEESIQTPKARRSFKLQKEELFYLFKKIS